MKQTVTDAMGGLRLYTLQPGDATKYKFWLLDLDEGCTGVETDPAGDTLFHDDWGRGLGSDCDGCVMVFIHMPSGHGCLLVDKARLYNLQGHYVRYHAGKIGGYAPMVAAVLLAVSVLCDEPGNLEGACAAMLQMPELLR